MAIKAGIEAALPAEKRDKVLVVTHGIPALMTAYLEVFVEAGPVLYSRQTKAGDPNGMFFAGSGYMKRPGAGYPDAEMIKGFAKKSRSEAAREDARPADGERADRCTTRRGHDAAPPKARNPRRCGREPRGGRAEGGARVAAFKRIYPITNRGGARS